jgi:hypothetical protein
MDLKTLLIFTLSVLFQINWAHSLFFHMKETERKCFIEEVPDETLVIGMKIQYDIIRISVIKFFLKREI